MKVKAAIILVCLAFVGFIGIVTLFLSVNIIQTGQLGVVKRIGVVNEVLDPGGFNIRLFLIHTVERYDITVRETDLRFRAYTLDAQNVDGQVSVQYQINPAEVMIIAQQFGNLPNLERRLHAMLLQETQNVFALKSAMELVEQRATLSSQIWDRLRVLQSNFHITITNVAIEGMGFSQSFETAVEQRAIADQALRQSQLDAERDMVYARRALEVSRLEAEAVLVGVRADAEALSIMQNAWGDLGAEIRDIMLRQLAIEKWNGVLPKVIGGGDFSFIINDLIHAQDSPD